LLALGAQDAMNLDGGGSSAMVVNGVLVTHPSDRSGLRPVASVLWAADSGMRE
jgi:exopolysaccharide biosynthesis protein